MKYQLQIRSRHDTHNKLRNDPELVFDRPCVYRLGSTSEYKAEGLIEINRIIGIKNSSNKLKMKRRFNEAGVDHPDFFKLIPSGDDYRFIRRSINGDLGIGDINALFPILAKRIFGSRGRGMVKIDNLEQFEKFLTDFNKDLRHYYFEKFHNYGREYRLHVSKNGCFYTNRKVRKLDTPKEQMFYFNNSNCSWLLEENAQFDKPVNWEDIVDQCVAALKHVKLDIGAFDVRVQHSENSNGDIRKNPKFKIIEVNSAPSFGTLTFEFYKQELKKLICAD